MEFRKRWTLPLVGALVVVYCVAVLGYVVTIPDLRIRTLLVDPNLGQSNPAGIAMQATPSADDCRGEVPAPGDLLLRIRDRRIRTFSDFTRELSALRKAPIPPGGQLYANADPAEQPGLPSLVEEENGPRWVEIEFQRPGETTVHETYVRVQSLPVSEIVVSVVWFVLQLGVFLAASLAYWHRPFDRAARVFFAVCAVTLGAFIGGFHWWVIAGSLWLLLPFAVCAILLPTVSLHFFLVYPRPRLVVARRAELTLWTVYVVTGTALAVVVGLLVYARWLNASVAAGEVPSERHVTRVLATLGLLHRTIRVYLVYAAGCFVTMLAALAYAFATTRNLIERNQLKWMFLAGALAAVPIGYSLKLALFDRVRFALGEARLPMFVASLLFTMAYVSGIIRHRLMPLERIAGRGLLYYATSHGITAACAAAIAVGSLVALYLNVSLSTEQAVSMAVILMLGVTLVLWVRDRFQREVDLRFFRQKYQLDKALLRMNRAAGHLVEPEALAERMLSSCRDVLQVQNGAVYLHEPLTRSFRLVGATGEESSALRLPVEEAFLSALRGEGTIQRAAQGTRASQEPAQQVLKSLRAVVVQALEADGEVAGFVALGAKPSGAPYTAEDVTFLTAMSQITSVALHGAKVHRELARLNDELQHKMETISRQQQQIAFLQAELSGARDSEQTDSADDFHRGRLRGHSPAIVRVLETVRKVAANESTVLIRGESGTGKELVAEAIHANSSRRDGPLVRVHCAALAPSLLESELFGHVKGAFTGAHRDRRGRFELAHGGTLFLDEIGDISAETQVKLLRVLQERKFEPVGGTTTIEVDVRLIAATHRNLEALIAQGQFREDLYYRLNVISITLPPLRERGEDILELALYFLQQASHRAGKVVTQIDADALAALESYTWPGNVRQLENVIERAVVLCAGDRIRLEDLPEEIVESARGGSSRIGKKRLRSVASASVPHEVPPSLDNSPAAEDERARLAQALKQSRGNKAQAARLLGMPRSTYFSKLRKYGLA